MNKTKKTIAFIMAMVSIITLSACSRGQIASVGTGEYPGAEVTLNGDNIYPVQCDDTLTWWKDMSDLGTTYENFGDTPIAKKLHEETGINVEYMHPAQGQGDEQIQLLIASDDLPDIVKYSWNSYPGGPEMAINDEYIYELGDLIDKFAPALKKTLADNPEWDRQIKTDNSKYFSIPTFSEPGLLQICYGPTIRADWLKKVNMEAPTTIEEWEKVLTAFKDMGVEYPFIGSFGQLLTTFASGFGFNSGWYHNDGQIKYGLAQPEYKEFLHTMSRWYKNGLIHPDFVSMDSAKINSDILNGKAGSTIFWAGSQMLPIIKAGESVNGFEIMGVQFPSEKKGENAEYSYVMAQVLIAGGSAISTNCKNPELAMRLIDYTFTDKGRMLSCFGIEGESYNMVDGYPTYTDVIQNNPQGYTKAQAIAAYTLNGHVPMVYDPRYIVQYYAEPELSAAQKEWNKTNMNDHVLPELYVPEEESATFSDIMVSVSTYADEMAIKFITGGESLDKFDEYVKQLETFGLNDAIKFKQDAYKRYMER